MSDPCVVNSIISIGVPALSSIIGGLIGGGAAVIAQKVSNNYQEESKINSKFIEGYEKLLEPIFGRYTVLILSSKSKFINQFLDIHFPCDGTRNKVISFLAKDACMRGVFTLAKSLRANLTKESLSDLQIMKLCFMGIAEAKNSDPLFSKYALPIFNAVELMFNRINTNRNNIQNPDFRNYINQILLQNPILNDNDLKAITAHTNQMAAATFSIHSFKYIFNFNRKEESALEQFNNHQSLLENLLNLCNDKTTYGVLFKFASDSMEYFYQQIYMAFFSSMGVEAYDVKLFQSIIQ